MIDRPRLALVMALAGLLAALTAGGAGAAGPDRPAGIGWTPRDQLRGSDRQAGDEFGSAIALDAPRMLVAAPGKELGVVYVFGLDAATREWSELDVIEPPGDPDLHFGHDVAIAGDQFLVSAPYARAEPDGDRIGAVHVFLEGVGPMATLFSSTPADGGEFGLALDISGDRLLVGAPGERDDAGSAHLFEGGGAVWTEVAVLTPSGDATQDHDAAGEAVAVDGDLAVVAAPWEETVAESAGAVYIFERDAGGSWVETARLTAPEGEERERFGNTVDLERDRLVVQAVGHEDYRGAAHVFERHDGVWQEVAEITAADGEAYDDFGHVALAGDFLALGAPDEGMRGAVYLHHRNRGGEGRWGLVAKLGKNRGTQFLDIGTDVAVEMPYVAAGAPGETALTDFQAVYVFAPIPVDPEVAVEGSCPGGVGVEVRGLTPDAEVAVFGSGAPGASVVDAGPCRDLELGLENAVEAYRRARASLAGSLSLERSLDEPHCGALFQVVDLASCTAAAVAELP